MAVALPALALVAGSPNAVTACDDAARRAVYCKVAEETYDAVDLDPTTTPEADDLRATAISFRDVAHVADDDVAAAWSDYADHLDLRAAALEGTSSLSEVVRSGADIADWITTIRGSITACG